MMMHSKVLLPVLFLAIAPWLLDWFAVPKPNSDKADTATLWKQHQQFFTSDTTLYTGYNESFAASGTCVQCHGFDTAQLASVDPLGNDINVVDDWRSTLMANSAKDPFWRAKVAHEVLVNPSHQQELEDKCTSCHAPLGHFNAKMLGQEHYSMAELLLDSVALDGVSCLACHQQLADNLGNNHSGTLFFNDTAKVAYGPYESPLATPMLLETGWKPEYSPHTADAGLCAGCHSLLTETVDLQGNYTGDTFVEQATYHEWLNSNFPAEQITCQSCHLPGLYKAGVQIAAGYDTPPRTPFFLHQIVGGNSLMLQIMKENKASLGLAATDAQFDESIDATLELLQFQSLVGNLTAQDRTADTSYFVLHLENLAGHKFPSGYPARRLFVQFLLLGENPQDTLFFSGRMDNDFELLQQNSGPEPHYDRIFSEEQVQIYELVLGDVNGNVTTVLERAASALKDNRLVPKGFSKNHEVYDTTQLSGAVLSDPNFNQNNGQEGSGTDQLTFAIPMNGYFGPVQAQVFVLYQSIPQRWLKELFDYSSPEIDTFKNMYLAADRSPVRIYQESVELEAFPVSQLELPTARPHIYPSLVNEGHFFLETDQPGTLQLVDLQGKIQWEKVLQKGTHELTAPLQPGLYLAIFQGKSQLRLTQKIIFL